MATLMQASRQWASRPEDERFTSLPAMHEHFQLQHHNSRELIVSSKKLQLQPDADNKGLTVVGPSGHGYAPTNWAFGQICSLAGAPAGYLRTLASPLAADCVNYGLAFNRPIEDVGVLLYKNGGEPVVRAATGPRYGRIWNDDITSTLIRHFGDGVTGDWRVPGEFGKAVDVTKANTTLFAGDRDMFVFLADETNRIEVPNRRNGERGSLARGFFMWNSEVGSNTWGMGTFLFDHVCCNRIVWGADGYTEVRIRHTVSAPDRWLDEIQPALKSYRESSAASINQAIEDARRDNLAGKVEDFLAARFGKRMVAPLQAVHQLEEQRPIETRWDAVTAATAYAKGVKWQNDRVDLERQAGMLLLLPRQKELVAA